MGRHRTREEKIELAERARRLREEGLSRREIQDELEIAESLGVSTKTVYYWTWDLPVPASARTGGDDAHMEMMRRRYWDRVLAEREDERQRIRTESRERVAELRHASSSCSR